MLVEEAAELLVRRLAEAGLDGFAPYGSTVARPSTGFYVPLTLINAGRGRPYEVEQALHKADGIEAPVLFAERFWPGGLKLLEDAKANYLDDRHAHISVPAPQMFVHIVDGDEVVPAPVEPGGLRLDGVAGAIAIHLLEHRDEDYQVTRLADEVNVSPATAQRVLSALDAEGLVFAQGRGPQKVRRLTDPTGSELLDRYAQDAGRDRRRAIRLRVLGDTPADVVIAIAHGLGNIPYALTGSVAASLAAPATTSALFPVEFWVNGPTAPEHIAKAIEGIVSEQGANVVLWREGIRGPMVGAGISNGIRVASRFRVYADLLADPRRGREQAAYYRESVIGF
jgi:predicted transcriptional regulator